MLNLVTAVSVRPSAARISSASFEHFADLDSQCEGITYKVDCDCALGAQRTLYMHYTATTTVGFTVLQDL